MNFQKVSLTDPERARIAEAYGVLVPQDVVVSRVPCGITRHALDGGYLWNGETNRIAYSSSEAPRANLRSRMWVDAARARKIRERRAHVAALVERGASREDILATARISASTLRTDCAAIGVEFHTQSRPARAIVPASGNRERVRSAHAPGLSLAEIARRAGLSSRATRGHLKRLGLPYGALQLGRKRCGSAAVRTRRAEIARLAAEGLTAPEIARRTGYSPSTVHFDARSAGVELTLARRGGRR